MDQPTPANSPLELVIDPPLSRDRVLRVAPIGFGLVVGLVLLALSTANLLFNTIHVNATV